MPPIFERLASAGNIAADEMLKTFNCGIGMVLIVQPDDVDTVITSLGQAGETVIRIGQVIDADDGIRFSGHLA